MQNNQLVGKKLPLTDKSLRNIMLILVILVVLFGILDLILLMIFGLGDGVEPNPTPTYTPSVTSGTTLPSITPSLLNIPNPTIEADSYKYVMRDCEIQLVAHKSWHATLSGRFGACVALGKDDIPSTFTDFRVYEKTLLIIIPFTENSEFTPNGPKTSEEYLKSLETLTNKFDPAEDFLYSKKTISIGGKSAIEAEIYNAKLGDTTQIFYKGFNGEYIIIWGGQNTSNDETSVRDIITSVQFLDRETVEE